MHRTRRALLATLLVAVGVSLGVALAAAPNIELLTFTVFVSGFLLGPGYGAAVGAGAASLFSVFNPLGAALPPLVIAQALGQSAVGAVGGTVGERAGWVKSRMTACVASGAAGLVLTVFYDALTNLGAYLAIAGEKSMAGLVKFIAAGLLFAGLHIVWNTALFALALPPTLRVLGDIREELRNG